MHADAYFAIGRSHKVCQDYARAGVVPARAGRRERAYAVACDGCSSSPDTDLGARFLAVSALHCLGVCGDYEKWTIWQAREYVRGAPFPSVRSLDATLLLACEQDDGSAKVLAFGDGVVLARRRGGGVVESWEIDFQGAPAYLSYLLDPARLAQYLAEGYGRRKVAHRRGGEVLDVEEGCVRERDFRWERVFDAAEYDLVMVLTDGILSFQDRDLTTVPLDDVIPHVVDIRVPKGEFLVRSHRHFLTKVCPSRGWQHFDDFGSAALLLDPPSAKV